ncbi:hypothetical protein [Candidatus Oscillochloris fontis]|uniref:hypothetical protein n=1 Tax=Candidatus Oscillochloris fontis TaxID=2496868 RepID=UPI00101BE29F|nr:hypothetical protein [Candidatus Oscillochloris fontis]
MKIKLLNRYTTNLTSGIVKVVVMSILFIFGIIIFFSPTDNWIWDPSFYYAQMRSPIVEHDLDLRNETLTGNYVFEYTKTGLQESPWPIGPSILWSPSFLMTHTIMRWVNSSQANGFDLLSLTSVALSSIGYGAAGLILIYAICRYSTDLYTSLLITTLSLFATPLFYYMFRQPIMAHTASLFAFSLVVWIYLHLNQHDGVDPLSGLLFGVALGLCFLTRWTGFVMAIIPGVYFVPRMFYALKERSFTLAKQTILQIIILSLLAFITIMPQLSFWYRLHLDFFVMPQSKDAFVDSILPINTLSIFFHSNRGIFFWAPFILLGMFGLWFIPDTPIRFAAISIIILQIILIGYRVDWYSGGGFGVRYMIENLPLLVLGVVALFNEIKQKVSFIPKIGLRFISVFFCTVLIIHQCVLIASYHNIGIGWIDPGYGKGADIGVAWQWENFLRLWHDPSFWMAPRLFVGQNRQAAIVNYLAGIREPQAYVIPYVSSILTPLLVSALFVFAHLLDRRRLAVLLSVIACYCIAWAGFLYLV